MRAPRKIDLTLVAEWNNGAVRHFEDYIAGEEPLEIRAGDHAVSVTMRTPGDDLELAAGFLFTENVIAGRSSISALRHSRSESGVPNPNVVEVLLEGAALDPERLRRNFYAASSCGICGRASIDSVRVRGIRPPNVDFRVSAPTLCSLPGVLRERQAIFGRTGGLHAAGVFDSGGGLAVLREDVGRHNAVDKVVGWALLENRLPLSESILVVSGRGGFEIVQKALVAGIPVLACVSAPSGLAVRLARQFGLTLIGFLRDRRFVIYSGEHRMISEPESSEMGRQGA